jgi:hypothetical protein
MRQPKAQNAAGLAVVVAAVLIVTVGTVTSAGASVFNVRRHHSTTTTTKPKPANGIGVTQVVENEEKQYEAVKLVGVIDPAQGADEFTTPDDGKRFVAVQVQITGQSTGNDTNDANNNLSIVGSDKQVYSPDFDQVSGCTDFNDGQYTVTKGESEVGCVTYQVPIGVTVTTVKYNPNSGFSTNEASWSLNPPA